jgi:hypothetical protein
MGKTFKPSVERIFAHELAHAYILYITDFLSSGTDKMVEYENKIAKDMDPNAPERAVSDHGGLRDQFR